MSQFFTDESGATAIEYGLIVSLIAVAIVASISATGGGVSAQWLGMAQKLINAMN
jgi:pilus assembly protein Flp/PilA